MANDPDDHLMREKAETYDAISTRVNEAQAYCQRHCMLDAWGKIVWHAVLDDAIRLRAELAELLRKQG